MTLPEKLRLRLSTLLWAASLLGLLIAIPVLWDFSRWALPALALLALALTALPCWWWCRRRQLPLLPSWGCSALATLCLLAVALSAPVYGLVLLTALRPAAQPQAEMSNGSRNLTFQGMMHIGSESFYHSVIYDLESALANGAVIYYEGVRPDPEGDAWLGQLIGGGSDLNSRYRTLANACGLHFQSDYFQPLLADMQAHPERHVVADVSSLQMKQEYERLLAADPGFAQAMHKRASQHTLEQTQGDQLARFIDWQQRGSTGQKNLAGAVCRGVMSLVLNPRRSSTEPDPLDAVTLDYRNRVLAQAILADTHDKIFITYGAAHLPGLYALLRQADPRWHIVSSKWLRSIDTPENIHGALDFTAPRTP
ncbi:MAG: hypothetical protein RR100_06780 [Comamonas sp.]